MFKIIRGIYETYATPVDNQAGALNSLTTPIIRRSIFMSWNASLQLVADLILEAILLAGLLPFYLSFRLEFFLLTIVSAVVAFLTMRGIREGALDVTRGTLVTGLFVETSLVVGDVYLLLTVEQYALETLLVRLPFVLLTLVNVGIIANFLWLHFNVGRHRPNFRF